MASVLCAVGCELCAVPCCAEKGGRLTVVCKPALAGLLVVQANTARAHPPAAACGLLLLLLF
jgi:hypothetical protein